MDPVDRLNRLMQTLRQQMASSSKRAESPTSPGATSGVSRSARSDVEQLRTRIEERILALDPNDVERKKRARRVFVEAVIAWEFGDRLLLDGELGPLIDRVQESFAADPTMERELDEMLAALGAG